MVICTFLSGPMMFMSAQMIAINKDFAEQLKKFGFDLSIVSLIASIWVLFVFTFTKKYKRMPHRLTLCLIVSQVPMIPILFMLLICSHTITEINIIIMGLGFSQSLF